MNLLTMLNGGLKLHLEDEEEWALLAHLPKDAMSSSPREVAKRLGAKIEEPEDWESFILPDLEIHFSEGVTQIIQLISQAKENSKEGVGEILLCKKNSEIWYLVLNQARLNLEGDYKLEYKDELDKNEIPPNLRKIIARDRFYVALQGALLSYVFPE